MKITQKLLLTTLLCLTGAQLAHCSQVQARLTTSSTASTTPDEQKKKQALELLRQANELLAGTKDSAEQKQAVAQAVLQATTQATGQEIVERDAKRVKLSAAEEDENPENWLYEYAGQMAPEEQKKLEAAKIQALNKNRTTLLPSILYDLLTCMPRELTKLIASYDEPYELQGKLDQTFKITLPKDVKITAITPLLLPHGNILVIGLSDGCLPILKEQTDKQAKERWSLLQTMQADKSAITAIAGLKDQKFATGSAAGALTIWTPKQNGTIILTGISIKKIATLSNGNIVVGGTVGERAGQWQIWDPVTLKKLYSHQIEDCPFIDLLVLPDDHIIVNDFFQELGIYKQTTNGWSQERVIEAPSKGQDLCSLHLLPNYNILRCGQLGVKQGEESDIQMHILDHDDYDRCSHVLQVNETVDELCGPLTILSDGKLAVNVEGELTDPKTDDTDNIEIFDTSDTRYQLKIDDNILVIPLSDYKTKLQHLIVLPDGRLLGVWEDGMIRIWR
jgi:hypothetical protein